MMSLYRGILFLASLLLLFSGHASADPVSDLQNSGRAALNAQLAKSKTCTAANLKVRKEWYANVHRLYIFLFRRNADENI
jgi:tyrosinase